MIQDRDTKYSFNIAEGGYPMSKGDKSEAHLELTAHHTANSYAPSHRQRILQTQAEEVLGRSTATETAPRSPEANLEEAMVEIRRLRAEINWLKDQYAPEWALGRVDEAPPSYPVGGSASSNRSQRQMDQT